MTGKPPTPLVIQDDELRRLVAMLAARLGTTEELAIRTAISAELKRLEVEPTPREKLDALLARFPTPDRKMVEGDGDAEPPAAGSKQLLKERLEDFFRRYPKPDPTGLPADKAFYDEMSGEFD